MPSAFPVARLRSASISTKTSVGTGSARSIRVRDTNAERCGRVDHGDVANVRDAELGVVERVGEGRVRDGGRCGLGQRDRRQDDEQPAHDGHLTRDAGRRGQTAWGLTPDGKGSDPTGQTPSSLLPLPDDLALHGEPVRGRVHARDRADERLQLRADLRRCARRRDRSGPEERSGLRPERECAARGHACAADRPEPGRPSSHRRS